MDWYGLASGLSLSNLVLGLASLSWLLWRAHQVFETPVDDLIKLLGLEVPVAPIATLLDITTNSVAVHWKPPDQRSPAVKHMLKVNGEPVGEISNPSHAVNIINLRPGHSYTIRIIAVNTSNFQASSEAIRVRTRQLPSNDVEDGLNSSNIKEMLNPSIVAYRAFVESQTPPPAAPLMTREHSGSVSQAKRSSAVRRASPVTYGDIITPPAEVVPGCSDFSNTVMDLTARLEQIRHEIEESEKIDEEEEREYQTTQLALIERRDSLRQQLRGRDDESNELKRNVTSLERQNTAAQAKKLKQEKMLNQRLAEMSKLRDEVERWERESLECQQELQEIFVQKQEFLELTQAQTQLLSHEQEEDMQAVKTIEESIREVGIRVKELEEEKRAMEELPADAGLSERQKKTVQEETEWGEKLQHLQNKYQAAWSAYTHAQHLYQQAQQRLDFLSARHNSQVTNLAQYGTESHSLLNESLIGQVDGGSRHSVAVTDPPRPQSLPGRGLSSGSNTLQTPSFFSHINVLPTASSTHTIEGISEAEVETLTCGALASPTAGALLPAGLFGDDAEDVLQAKGPTCQAPYLPGLGAAPGPESIEGMDESRQDVTSPLSVESQSPSLISSPYGSTLNFHHHKLSESRIETDGISVRSASSSSRAAPTRRFADVFGFPRLRATSNDGFPLGSLKRYQSRSMPRQDEDGVSGLAVANGAQRRGGSSGGLFGSVTQAFGRMGGPSSKVVEESDIMLSTSSTSGGGQFSIFGSRSSAWAARTSSPRPASTYSTYSTENALPHPSTDNHPFGWSVKDSTNQHLSTRNSSISNPWPTFSSRRQSIQHDSSTSLVHNISQLDVDSQELPEAEKSPPQAPIGTKPTKSKHNSPQKQLNPAARDFRSMLSRDRKGEKSRKGDKPSAVDDETSFSADNSSPPEPRKSKEKRFSSTAESFDEPFDDQTVDSPAKPNEKESFVRKITRKGSSTRFSGFSSGLFSRKGGQQPDEVEEDGLSSNLGRSLESVVSSQQSPGDKRGILSSFKRRGKKGTETPSISEASMASETGDETDERVSVDVDDPRT